MKKSDTAMWYFLPFPDSASTNRQLRDSNNILLCMAPQAVPADKYLQKALDAGVKCDTCFLASDDLSNVVPEFQSTVKRMMPDCQVKWSPQRKGTLREGKS